MSPNLRLRNVLETMKVSTLDTLLRFLQVQVLPDLRSQLTSMAQLFDETAYYFVIRCLEMRQKVTVACKKQSDDITYDPNLVQQLFLRTLFEKRHSKSICT